MESGWLINLNIEKTLHLPGMQIDGEKAVGPGGNDQVGHHSGGNRHAGLIFFVGAAVAEVGHHGGDASGRIAFGGVDHDEPTAFHMLSDYIRDKDIPNGVVVAGDIGATKRSRNFAQALDLPLAIIEKRRQQLKDGSKAQALNIIGDVRGKNCILFDDEIDTAGTMVQAMNFLKKEGAEDIYICATHAVFSDPAVQRLTNSPAKEIVVTNTIGIPPQRQFSKLTVLSIAPLLAEVIRRIHLGISVGELFNQ